MSRRRLAHLSYESRMVVSATLSLFLVFGPEGIAGIAEARGAARPAKFQLVSLAGTASSAPTVPVGLTADTLPSQGQAGSSVVYVSGSGFPSGTILPANVTVAFETTCGGTPVASTNPSAVQLVFGTTRKVQVLLPALLRANTYYVSLSGSTSIGTAFASTNCSQVQVIGAASLGISKTHSGSSFTQGQ